MKLNNKGFAISTIMYMVLILALSITITSLAILNSRSKVLEKLKNEVLDDISDKTSDDFLCNLKEGNGLEVGDLYNCRVSNTEKYRFYLLSTSDTDISFIMGDNIVFSSGDYGDITVDNESLVKYNSDNNEIPTSALAVLKNITDNWYYLDSRVDTVDNIDYTDYKARLLSFSDISEYVSDNTLTIGHISNTLTSTIYNGTAIYSISDNKVIVDKQMSDEYNIVPVITISREKVKS